MSNARKLGNMTTHGLDGDFNVDPTDNTLVVDSTNNRVGIGSATPTTTLDITGTATATAFSGPLTGNVTGTTSSISNHDTDALSEGSTNLYFTNARADARAQLKIDALVDSAPGTLDTLNELAAALGDDANFATTTANSIALKAPINNPSFTGNVGIGTTNPGEKLEVNGVLQIKRDGDHPALRFVEINSGTSTTRGYIASGDWAVNGGAIDDFGISSSNTGDLLLATNAGSERLRIQSSTGNVGIGTNSPTALLNLQKTRSGLISSGSSDTGAVIKLHTEAQWESGYGNNPAASTNDYLGSIEFSTGDNSSGEGVRAAIRATVDSYYNENSIVFETATGATAVSPIERMRVLHNGNVGIGTSSPAENLHVKGSGNALMRLQSGTSSARTQVQGYDNSGSENYVLGSNDNTNTEFWNYKNGYMRFATNSTEAMRIDSSGNVGIGNTSPDQRLTIGTDNSTSNVGYIRLRGYNTLESNIYKTANYGIHMDTDSNSQGIRIDGGKLVLGMTGNVGVGIETPAQLLHVQAGATGNGTIRVGGGAGLEISHDNSSTTIQRIDSLYRTTSANANLQLRTGILTAHIGTASTEAMRLDGTNGLQVITDSSNGTTADNVSIRYNGTAGGHQSGYLFKDKRNVVNAAIKNDLQDDGVGTAAAHLRFQTSHGGTLTTQMTIDRYGQVMMPNQPSFRAYSTTDYTANGTLESANWTEQHDNNGDFSNGRFTAPVDGVYLFEVMWDSLSSQAGLSLLKNTSFYIVRWEPTGLSSDSWESRHYSTTVKLSSGDYVRLVGVHASGSNPFHMGGGHWGFFSGHLLG